MTELEALKAENESLKNLLENMRMQAKVLSDTAKEILEANVNLKTAGMINDQNFQKQIAKLNQDLAEKDYTIKKLTPEEVPNPVQ